jgi:hypothetical protein
LSQPAHFRFPRKREASGRKFRTPSISLGQLSFFANALEGSGINPSEPWRRRVAVTSGLGWRTLRMIITFFFHRAYSAQDYSFEQKTQKDTHPPLQG